ncbi:HD-GYP domain-containing protein [Rhodoferax sp. UBA5149]|uniref:HD-GYP domain-containing protein n=1 Tax=Rhodoferax sp. UBA5149 TaxID=1947379 RepID=UPI0025E6FDAF|nr:HD domain-containing phosphohydrolase [Rhodoferax sp. UBA5149]
MTVQNENEYEDLLGLWADLESGLGIILGSPGSIQEFEQRVWQYDRWMQALLKRDTDVGLYLLFQLAMNSPVGYSASHALVSAVLCHLIAVDLKLSPTERDNLVHAALTMNIAMTALQDQLAGQTEKPNVEQRDAINTHAVKGRQMLVDIGVADALWLDTITLHHDDSTDRGDLRDLPPARRLARILRIVDRYAAMISPRQSREGRTATESARSIITQAADRHDEVGHALIRAVGLCPPGTYVRLDNKEVAVVMRRSSEPDHPHVAIVINEAGTLLNPPRLHRTANSGPKIKASLPTSAVRVRINHYQVLQLGAYAAQHP